MKECIRYVQFKTNNGIGYGCYVIQWNRINDDLFYKVGSSFCSPKENFIKSLARTIANGRIKVNFQSGKVKSINIDYISDNDFNNILNDLFYNTDFKIIPNWSRKSFNKGKYSFTLKQSNINSDKCVKCNHTAEFDSPHKFCKFHWIKWWSDGVGSNNEERRSVFLETLDVVESGG